MAVTATFTRVRHGVSVPIFEEVVNATFSGTYVTGGFTWNPLAIKAGPGSSPTQASVCYTADVYGSLAYSYVTTFSGSTATTKIFTTANTELANAAAVPDATATVVLLKGR